MRCCWATGNCCCPPSSTPCVAGRSLPRRERLRALARVPGVYVPGLYAPRYDAAGTLLAIEPIEADLPPTIAKQTWRGNTLSHSTVITPEAAWPSIHMVEVARSCPELCRFCLASYLTLPFRTASLDDGLIPAVETGPGRHPAAGSAGGLGDPASPVRRSAELAGSGPLRRHPR